MTISWIQWAPNFRPSRAPDQRGPCPPCSFVDDFSTLLWISFLIFLSLFSFFFLIFTLFIPSFTLSISTILLLFLSLYSFLFSVLPGAGAQSGRWDLCQDPVELAYLRKTSSLDIAWYRANPWRSINAKHSVVGNRVERLQHMGVS